MTQLSPRAQEIKESVKRTLTETLAALERADTDEEVQTVLGILEEFASLKTSDRLRPLHGVEATLRASTARLQRLTPSRPSRYPSSK